MKRGLFSAGIILLLLVTLSGCRPATEAGDANEEGNGDGAQDAPTPERRGTSTPAATPEPAATEATNGAEAVRQLAKEDLARRLERPAGEIEIVGVKAVAWPDAALGCPLPGVDYEQVTTPGFEIVLQAGEESYEYHTDEGQRIVLCDEDGRPVMPTLPVDPGQIQDGDPWLPVDPPTSNDDGG